ncbi:MAG: LL-diaminopimelate aminotransferase [Chitinivibrionales bacterium]
MIRINENYKLLKSSYLFSEIAQKVSAFQKENPEIRVIKLGIGDVTRALPEACIKALHEGVEEMSRDESFKGYGPEQGYEFLREAIAENDYKDLEINKEEIFVSDGSKCDTGNFQEILAGDIKVCVPDPVYPVYVDTNVMAGRAGTRKDDRYTGILYLEGNEENGFVPSPPDQEADLIYLCFPNNPTGATATKEDLKAWVDYAHEKKALILFDAAYCAFIRDNTIPKSIYEIEGAKEVAVEFRSFSKTAGFTGTRCAFTVVPKECRAFDSKGERQSLHPIWNRRHSTKFNGVAYPVQRAAAAVYTDEGQKEIKELTDYYLKNASLIRDKMEAAGYKCTGGINSPYIWIEAGTDSKSFFDRILNETGVVVTPGAGFGKCGDRYIRISAFNHYSEVKEAMERITKAL